MSFLPLLSKDVVLPANAENFAKYSSQLTKSLIKTAQGTLDQILKRKRSFQQYEQRASAQSGMVLPQNHFLAVLEQDLLEDDLAADVHNVVLLIDEVAFGVD